MNLFTWMFNVSNFNSFQQTGMIVMSGLVLTLLTLKFVDLVKRSNANEIKDGQV